MNADYIIRGLYGLAMSAEAKSATDEAVLLRAAANELKKARGEAALLYDLLLDDLAKEATVRGLFAADEVLQ